MVMQYVQIWHDHKCELDISINGSKANSDKGRQFWTSPRSSPANTRLQFPSRLLQE